jgi:hypothetical protein
VRRVGNCGEVFVPLLFGVPLAFDGGWSLVRKARGRVPYEKPDRAGAIYSVYLIAMWVARRFGGVYGGPLWALVGVAGLGLEFRRIVAMVKWWRGIDRGAGG